MQYMVTFQCEECKTEVTLQRQTERRILKRYKRHLCLSCRFKVQFASGVRDAQIEALRKRNYDRNGKSIEEIFGKESAEKTRAKMSKNNSGSGNPMFGKPAAKSSGRGLAGYFHGIHFRSSLELSYIIHLIDNDIEFSSAERKEFSIPYVINGKHRTYFPDFVLYDGTIIEVKPKEMLHLNEHKFSAARKKYGDKFVIKTEEDFRQLSFAEIKTLYEHGEITIEPRCLKML